ncbi:hypothetical protein HZB89_02100 [archaeon]|nr:hypothetical protein [archaeon]
MPEKEKKDAVKNQAKEKALPQEYLSFFIILAVALVALSYFFMPSAFAAVQKNILWILLFIAFMLLVWKGNVLIKLNEYERAVISRFGKVSRVGGPGWTLVIPGIEGYRVVDTRTQVIDVPPQEAMTKDSIKLRVDAVLYIAVNRDAESVIKSVVAVEDYKRASAEYIKGIIRDVIGELELTEVISSIDVLNTKLMKALEALSNNWGVKVESVAITDVIVPEKIITAMHEEKAARQERLARKERAEAAKYEIEAIRDAASKLDDKSLAFYYLEALKKLGEGQSTKFIFPMELSRLAEGIAGKVGGVPKEAVEAQLLEKYKDVIKGFLDSKRPAAGQENPAEPAKAIEAVDEKESVEEKQKQKPRTAGSKPRTAGLKCPLQ